MSFCSVEAKCRYHVFEKVLCHQIFFNTKKHQNTATDGIQNCFSISAVKQVTVKGGGASSGREKMHLKSRQPQVNSDRNDVIEEDKQ